jgi:phage portal protein BeeE
LTFDDNYSNIYTSPFNDTLISNARVNIAVNILIRNIARADFVLERDGVELKSGPLFSLFHRPNEHLSRYDLWKETAAWWLLEGEAFWWFGPD